MSNKQRLIGVLSMIFTFISCSNNVENQTEIEKEPVYTFAIAGHVYGNPDTYTSSVYPPFLVKLDSVLQVRKLDQLILTGDVVAHPTPENWETVKNELDNLAINEWHISPGNHDISPYMDTVIQPQKYMALERENNLFLILNTSHPGWTVDSVQQIFIANALQEHKSAEHVFVFSHQLWWEKNPPAVFELDSLRPNSFALLDGPSDFWTDAFPNFEELEKEVYFFAGDMGCYFGLPGYYEDHFNNFHFYGSGMGGAVEDNFIYVQIFQDRTVKIERVDF